MKFAQEGYADVLPEMRLLYPAHWAEIGADKDEMPLDVDYERYEELARLGIIRVFTARSEGQLVGYQTYFVTPPLHHKSRLTAVCDFEYLKPSYRKGWNGINFSRFAESCLRNQGVRKIMRECTTRRDFSSVLKYEGYKLTAHLYSKVL